jgi:para-nitrobenzyl esterase
VVSLADGKVAGRTEGAADAFLGMPFAAAPVGPLRWQAPQPEASWAGVRQATAFGPDCIQEPMQDPPGPGFVNRTSEDCLSVNVWRPHGLGTQPRKAGRLPVMVWIYGGAFIMGAGSFPPYDGTRFAESGVVLVTFNYRLGRFGTFAVPALVAEAKGAPVANYGLMDQIAALRWVRRNIAAFGGDPGNVTIFGESAGASSVNFLMASPPAASLFGKAISESGGSSADLQTLDQAQAQGLAWARAAGVAGDDLAALRRLPAATVWGGPVRAPAFPVIDGQLIRMPNDVAFAKGAVAHVPYLVGSNGYEQSLLQWLPGAEKALVRNRPDTGGVLRVYEAAGLDPQAALKAMWGDAAMTLPTRSRADDMAATGSKTWLYRYAYVPEALRTVLPGAGHEAEIEMVFDTRNGRIRHVWSARDLAIGRMMHGYWVDFARTGNPNGAGLPSWPAFNDPSRPEMVFANGGVSVARDLDRDRLDALAAAILPKKAP